MNGNVLLLMAAVIALFLLEGSGMPTPASPSDSASVSVPMPSETAAGIDTTTSGGEAVSQANTILHTKEQSYSGDDKATLIVENKGPAAVMFGTFYTLERRDENGGWGLVEPKGIVVFHAIGIALMGAGEWEQEVDLNGLPAGHYRFVKEVNVADSDVKQRLYAEFDVKP